MKGSIAARIANVELDDAADLAIERNHRHRDHRADGGEFRVGAFFFEERRVRGLNRSGNRFDRIARHVGQKIMLDDVKGDMARGGLVHLTRHLVAEDGDRKLFSKLRICRRHEIGARIRRAPV
jgi:hypothetical protein